MAVEISVVCLLGYNTMFSDRWLPLFWSNKLPPSSGLKVEVECCSQNVGATFQIITLFQDAENNMDSSAV